MAKSGSSLIRQIAYTVPVDPSNSVDLPNGVTRGVVVNGAGFVSFTYPNGLTDTLYLNAGVLYPYTVKRIMVDGTSATGIKAGY